MEEAGKKLAMLLLQIVGLFLSSSFSPDDLPRKYTISFKNDCNVRRRDLRTPPSRNFTFSEHRE